MPHLPPGPAVGLAGYSMARRMQREPLEFFTEVGRQFGDIAHWKIGPYRFFLINHPDLIKEVLVTKAKSFRKVPRIMKEMRKIDGEGLVVSEGDFWARQRRLVQPAFQPRRMARYADVVVDYARRMVDRWESQATLDISTEMTRLTCAIIARLLFDVELTGKAAELGKAVHTISEISTEEMGAFVNLPDWFPTPKKRRKRWAINTLDSLIRDVIRQRRESGEDKGDLLSMLLLAIDKEGGSGGMTDEQARDEAMTMFNAGHDTTAAGLAWVWYLIATNPGAEAKLREEVEAVLGDRRATFEDVEKLSFTEMVVKESLRLYPPAWLLFSREATEDIKLGEYDMPRKTWAYIVPWVTHRDERFFENPAAFDPERFAPGRAESIPQMAYVPFGGGPHHCIGKGLATMEMVLIVATVMQRYRMELPAGTVIEPEPFMSLRPKGGLPMRLTRNEAVAV